MKIEHDMVFECNMCEWKLEIQKGIWEAGTEDEVFSYISSIIDNHAIQIHQQDLERYLSENIIADYDINMIPNMDSYDSANE